MLDSFRAQAAVLLLKSEPQAHILVICISLPRHVWHVCTLFSGKTVEIKGCPIDVRRWPDVPHTQVAVTTFEYAAFQQALEKK